MTEIIYNLPGETSNEKAPYIVRDTELLSVIDLAQMKGFWPSIKGAFEGALEGSELPLKWKSVFDLQAFAPSYVAPGFEIDEALGLPYLRLGYGINADGEALSRRHLEFVTGRIKTGGSGHAINDVVTLTNGVQVRVLAVSSGAVVAYAVKNGGAFSIQPTAAITQTATTGAGTGLEILAEFTADNCGCLELAPAPDLIPADDTFSIIVPFRCPVVGGVAGSNPGGFILGGQLSFAEGVYDASVNNRWWGLAMGGYTSGPTAYPGRLFGYYNGQSIHTASSPTATDYRDGQWHVAMMTFGPGVGAASGTLWVDGAQVGSVSTFAALNTSTGKRMLRIGAAGLPDDGTIGNAGATGGAALDIGEPIIIAEDLKADAYAAHRQLIGNVMLKRWRGGGAWG